MKRIFALLLVLLMLCGCSNGKKAAKKEVPKSDPCDFLINAEWEGNDEQCVNVIAFKKNGGFSNWCYCGSPVGAGDVTEKFRYRVSDRSVLLYDCDDELVETGKILYADNTYLIIDLWQRAYVYENLNAYRPSVHTDALEYTGTEEMSKPCLTVLDYKDDTLTVSAYNYDKDAADNFEVWELKAANDITFSSVSVTVENEIPTVEVYTLTEEDYENIGEFFNYGYCEINRDGEVQSIVFYGELIIQK